MIDMKEKYSLYEYEIYKQEVPLINHFVWVYKIFCDRDYLNQCRDIESDEWFESEEEARFACIGHIGLLENGE
jgi:hypothetical protein